MGKITEIHREKYNQVKNEVIDSIKNMLILDDSEITFKHPFKYDGILCVGLNGNNIVLSDDSTEPMQKLNEYELLYICEEIEEKRFK